MRILTVPAVLTVLVLATSVGAGQRSELSDRGATSVPKRIEAEAIENLYQLAPGLYSGGEPRGAVGFARLQELGVQTIISVDGAQPDAEAARRLGMRTVHLPIGYDEVPRDQAVRLIQAVRLSRGPVFVHCHHGQHRGPAAAAVCAMAVEGWSPEHARSWLELAGTAPDYTGLYASVESFAPPTPEELAAVGDDLPERAEVPALVDAMIDIDARWDGLKAIRAAGFRTPADRPDLDPPHEARLLLELLREAARLPEAQDRGPDFAAALSHAQDDASALESALRDPGNGGSPAARAGVEAAFRRVGQGCTACHARFRN